jgi:crotonobetainyl-CoA:carnitine CoA-transferase CaiB-like acyl-CoA transferase
MVTALQDLAVLECGTRAAVGMCGKLLANLGARVTKLEPPDGDPSRHEGPFLGDLPHLEQSGLFVYLNRGKRSVTLDLDTVAGRVAVRRLAAVYDVLIVGGTREEIERWGLNYDLLADVSPELICTAITPFGLTGPRRDYADSEIVVAALSGVGQYIPGPAESASDPPVAPPTHLTDFIARDVSYAPGGGGLPLPSPHSWKIRRDRFR